MVDVSVVVATFRSGPALDRTFASLDAQTLSPDRFEVRFVDDGSDDGTVDRLRAYAATRPHVHVTQIAPSGWPSRPRNVAIDEAAGEYVLFMDHDDELFPRGLERAVATARANDADAVNVKEVKTTGWGAGWQTFYATNGDAVPLNPMTPHKLYRTAFLREHGIRFPEGRRVLWEDIDFNIAVMRHTRRIVRLDEPVYRWVIDTGANHSRTYHDDADTYFEALERVLRCAHEQLDTAELRPLRDRVLLSNFELRLLRHLGPVGATRTPEFRKAAPAHVRRILTDWLPAELDARLQPFDRPRAHLARAGDLDTLTVLAEHDAHIVPRTSATSLGWTSAGLAIEVTSQLELDGCAYQLLDTPSGLRRPVPEVVRAAVPVEALLATDWHARVELDVTVRGRRTRDALRVPTELDGDDGRARRLGLSARGRAVVSPAALRAAGDGLPEAWDLAARAAFAGLAQHRRLDVAEGVALPSALRLADGAAMRVWRTATGVAVHAAPSARAVRESIATSLRYDRHGRRIEVTVSGLHADETSPVTLELGGGLGQVTVPLVMLATGTAHGTAPVGRLRPLPETAVLVVAGRRTAPLTVQAPPRRWWSRPLRVTRALSRPTPKEPGRAR